MDIRLGTTALQQRQQLSFCVTKCNENCLPTTKDFASAYKLDRISNMFVQLLSKLHVNFPSK